MSIHEIYRTKGFFYITTFPANLSYLTVSSSLNLTGIIINLIKSDIFEIKRVIHNVSTPYYDNVQLFEIKYLQITKGYKMSQIQFTVWVKRTFIHS